MASALKSAFFGCRCRGNLIILGAHFNACLHTILQPVWFCTSVIEFQSNVRSYLGWNIIPHSHYTSNISLMFSTKKCHWQKKFLTTLRLSKEVLTSQDLLGLSYWCYPSLNTQYVFLYKIPWDNKNLHTSFEPHCEVQFLRILLKHFWRIHFFFFYLFHFESLSCVSIWNENWHNQSSDILKRPRKFEKISQLCLNLLCNVKWNWKIFQIFVALSEYLSFV